ncbi:MAG: hypothetical protein NZM38_05890 [Cytophagales bacterium]|nr:hypothetical protein [Cytophagales bacterium]MDW8384286.1 hypothetical protein [Flammeovirgaceae bacterium]
MSFQKANKLLVDIIKCRLELSQLAYNDPKYDEIEDRLHILEDIFENDFGKTLKKVIQEVYEKYSSKEKVLSPISYIAREYYLVDQETYHCNAQQGILVKMPKLTDKPLRLAFLPNPLRLIVSLDENNQYEIWSSEE